MGSIGAPEIILIILALVLLFGAKKLPELARGSGRALRIFKAETKGLSDEDEEKREEHKQIEAQRSTDVARPVEHQAEPTVEPHRTEPER
ncbi:MAG TPA: Sec-independent protein translocase subunit TatA [Nocardioidaceae bacterium]|jgi:sec-independent protein translocase protein TatA|nr:Sec-independent protein translocase subunit TatA [Nocardioidaceae bacterium]